MVLKGKSNRSKGSSKRKTADTPQKFDERGEKEGDTPKTPVAKKPRKDPSEPEFSYVRFKFLLRSPDTVVQGLQQFVDACAEKEDEDEEREGLRLLESYLKSSPQCSEVLELLTPKSSSNEISLVCSWLRLVLQNCTSVLTDQAAADLRLHLVKALLNPHAHLIINSLRRGNKTAYVRSTLLLLITISGLGNKFAKLLYLHLDLSHANWPGLLLQRDRRDEIDVRASVVAIVMSLLQMDDDKVTKYFVEQKVLLQGILMGLKYDRSEYVIHSLNTIHRCVVMNGAVGKSSKMHLFNSQVLKELLTLYRWPGPTQWKCQPTEDENTDYTEEQAKVAEWVHPLLTDLLTNHKLGIAFRDKSYGIAKENKNRVLSQVLQSLVTAYDTPVSHQLVTAILKACPDQTATYLNLLRPYLSPRPTHTWYTCLRFFLKIMENHDWPEGFAEDARKINEEMASLFVQFLFPSESILNSLKDGLKNACTSVRHHCLHALEVMGVRGRRFCQISRDKMGPQAPLTLGIEGFVSKMLPSGQVLLNVVDKCVSKDGFTPPAHTDTQHQTVPHVSRFEHVVGILCMYSLTADHLISGPADTLPALLRLVTEVMASDEDIDSPPDATPAHLPALHLLFALSRCDAKKLNLFGKGGSQWDPKGSLLYQLVCVMQCEGEDDVTTHMAHSLIVQLLSGTGLFEGFTHELEIWLRHLKSTKWAPSNVVVYFVRVLRQYMTNPYPALDRLTQLTEEAHPFEDGRLSNRQEFSPLVMFALEGDLHSCKEVHLYVSAVLIDILHALYNTFTFSRLVHSLASDLNPDTLLYLTLHSAEERVTSQSVAKRLCKKLRPLKQLKCVKHSAVYALQRMVAGKEGVEEVVQGLSPSACLPLIQVCLRYLDDLVFASSKREGELLNTKVAEMCMEAMKQTFLRLANIATTTTTADTTNTNADTTASEPQSSTNLSDLWQLRTNHLEYALVFALSHPLVNQWLFEEGFQQGGTPREPIVTGLCDLIQAVSLHNKTNVCSDTLDAEVVSDFDLVSKCQGMLQAASESGEHGHIPDKLQPLLCQCLETVFIVGGMEERFQGFLILVSLPVDSFVSSSSHAPLPLAKTVCQLANTLQESDTLKSLVQTTDLNSSMTGLFRLVSVLSDASLASLTLKLIHISPDLCSACCASSFEGALKRLDSEESWELLPLLEAVMGNNGECRTVCGQWLHKHRRLLGGGRDGFCSLMLRYTRLALHSNDNVSDDVGVKTIGDIVSQKLRTQHFSLRDLDPTLLQLLCHLVNFALIGTSDLDKLLKKLLSSLNKTEELAEAHVQLLAAIIRHQSLLACDLQQEEGEGEREGRWAEFEKKAGRVMLACLLYLTAGGKKAEKGGVDRDKCHACLVQLCQEMLNLTLNPDVKAEIVAVWTDIVNGCLKHHYKDAQYVSLLRQLVEKVFTEEERISKDDVTLSEDNKKQTANKRSLDVIAMEVDSDEDGEDYDDNNDNESDDNNEHGDEDDSDEDDTTTSKPNISNTKSPLNQPSQKQKSNKTVCAITHAVAKRLKLTNKADIGRKCLMIFGEEDKENCTSLRSDIVRQWTGCGRKGFFLWSREHTMMTNHSRTNRVLTCGADVIEELCKKVIGHTAFLPVLLERENEGVKGEVVGLLACLVRLHSPCCSILSVNALLAAYGATLSITDQNLLYLLFAYDLYGEQELTIGLWGERSVQELERRREMGRYLPHETSLDTILELLDPVVMATTILHFPLTRTMDFQLTERAMSAERMRSRETCYDPRFLLQMYFHFTGPEHIVNVKKFVSSKGLGLTLVALSSHDATTRRLAISILCNLHSHLESRQGWSGAPGLLAVLRAVRNGMTRECQKVPCIVAVFLARVADIVVEPESDMYEVLHSFLFLKPALDLHKVPEFFKFFNSPLPKQRVWILRLLHDGLRETGDHQVYKKCSVYKLLLCHANSSLSDAQDRRETLRVVVKASSIATVVKDLVTRHALLAWFTSFIKEWLSDTPEMMRLVCSVLHNVCYTQEFNQRLWWLSLPRLSRQCYVVTPLLACVRLMLHSCSQLDLCSLEMLEDILNHPHLAHNPSPTLVPPTPRSADHQ